MSGNEAVNAIKGAIKEINFEVFMILLIFGYLMISGQAKPTAAFVVGAYMYFQTTQIYTQFVGYFDRWKNSL